MQRQQMPHPHRVVGASRFGHVIQASAMPRFMSGWAYGPSGPHEQRPMYASALPPSASTGGAEPQRPQGHRLSPGLRLW